MFTALPRPNRSRRGVTLVEMLVVVALVVLMMVILVQIFQSALGAMSASRTTQELDVSLRAIDSMIRSDLSGVTARMTPPNDPALKQGYFEYIENSPADLQGEDTDDALAFTTKAPEGQVFTGRQYLSGVGISNAIQPTTITSQVAEVIYFWRNGNLYRRVFLVVPDRSTSFAYGPAGQNKGGGYNTSIFGGQHFVSWLGLNDISARPGGFDSNGNPLKPIFNDLGDLTNRENRAFRPRFISDFSSVQLVNGMLQAGPPDGIPDDNNADSIPDYYPTLYFDGVGTSVNRYGNTTGWAPNGHVNETTFFNNSTNPLGLTRVEQKTANSSDVYAFPFIYPGMYSVPEPYRANNGLGWVHYQPANANPGLYVNQVNHSPLDLGDTPSLSLDPTQASQKQTWWGFPTWRETMSGLINGSRLGWVDPIIFVNSNGSRSQPLGLRPFPASSPPVTYNTSQFGGANFLPAVYSLGTSITPPFFDGVGSSTFVATPSPSNALQSVSPNAVWEDDLILTNVRSFDVKAYDGSAPLYNIQNNNTFLNGPFAPGYLDLGYGGYGSTNYSAGWLNANTPPPFQPALPGQLIGEPQGFGHEGRIPSRFSDFRIHSRRPTYIDTNGNLQNNNLGDDNAGVIRLSHTFDTWSTAYTNAPDQDILLTQISPTTLPVYPSFPPPYPSALRGIQIQIRVTDPRSERTKVLTIRHDFTDKLTN